jgi:PAS domain S-box-containing protein
MPLITSDETKDSSTTTKQHWRLSRQILAAVAIITLASGLFAGEVVRRIETDLLKKELDTRNKHSVALISAVVVDAMITEDRPLIETIIGQAANSIEEIHFIDVFNESGQKVASWAKPTHEHPNHHAVLKENIVFQGETFGSVTTQWDLIAANQQLKRRVLSVQGYVAGGMILLATFFFIVMRFVVSKPLGLVHNQIHNALTGKSDDTTRLPRHAARELAELGASAGHLTTLYAERRAFQIELSNAREQLVDAIESLSDGFAIYDANDRLVICNQRYKEIYSESADLMVPGTQFEDIIREGAQRGQYQIFEGDVEEWVNTRMMQHLHPSEPVEQELPNGRWLRIEERKTRDGGIVGFRVDITELKQREFELRKSEERMRATVDTAMDCIVSINTQGEIIQFNPAAEDTFGFKQSDVLGKEMTSLIVPEQYRKGHREGMAHFLKTGEGPVINNRIEIEAQRSDGFVFPIELSISVSKEADGDIFVAYIRDITERRQAEIDLTKAKEDAEVANQAKSQFLAMMSHEIRTPINGVLGTLGLLTDTKLNEEQIKYTTAGRQSAEGLLGILNDILDFSKMEAGKLDFENVPFELTQLIEVVTDVLKPRASEKEIAIDAVIESDTPRFLKGDEGRIRQVLLNLAGNAVKFTDHGGVFITVSAENETDNETTLKFEVSDTGIGINPAHHDDLFAEFTTLNPAYTQKFGGTGLGLAISRSLIQMMGGSIDFTSTPDEGSRFWFTLTLPKLSKGEIEEHITTNTTATENVTFELTGRILLAEDNPANQMIAKTMLQKSGLEVDVAANGLEAVSACTKRRYDLILMDVGMPEMGGVEATQEIRNSNSLNSKTPIVAMTAHVMRGDRESLLSEGMDDYLAKPASKVQLLETVRKWLPGTSLGVSTKQRLTAETTQDDSNLNISSIDRAILIQLGEDTDPSMLPDLIGTFISHAKERFGAISEATEAKDMHRLEEEAHALKSSAATFGANRLHQMAANLENAGREKDVDFAELNSPQLVEEGNIVVEELETFLVSRDK